jgi:hypothetical protein
MDRTLYPCPCCGYYTLTAKPPGTYLICPICCWEDDGDIRQLYGDRISRSNQVSLPEAQRNFLAFGACEKQWLDWVRQPTVEDVRDPNWQPLDIIIERQRKALIKKITLAFQNTKLEDGITIHQARALDDYEDPQPARKIDSHLTWPEIPDPWLENFSDVFPFMDAKGFRYYIPAYMIWCLKSQKVNSNSYWATVYYLKQRYRDHFDLFNHQQLTVIQEFLEFTNYDGYLF